MLQQQIAESKQIAQLIYSREVYTSNGMHSDLFSDSSITKEQKQRIIADIAASVLRLYRKMSKALVLIQKNGVDFGDESNAIKEICEKLKKHQLTEFLQRITQLGTNKNYTEKVIKDIIMSLPFEALLDIINSLGRPVGRADGFTEMAFGRTEQEMQKDPRVVAMSPNTKRGPLTSGLPEIFRFTQPLSSKFRKKDSEEAEKPAGGVEIIDNKKKVRQDVELAGKIKKGLANLEQGFTVEIFNSLLVDYYSFCSRFLAGKYKPHKYANDLQNQLISKYLPPVFFQNLYNILEKSEESEAKEMLDLLPYIFLSDFDVRYSEAPEPFILSSPR